MGKAHVILSCPADISWSELESDDIFVLFSRFGEELICSVRFEQCHLDLAHYVNH